MKMKKLERSYEAMRLIDVLNHAQFLRLKAGHGRPPKKNNGPEPGTDG
jgi:hypothetical protein